MQKHILFFYIKAFKGILWSYTQK